MRFRSKKTFYLTAGVFFVYWIFLRKRVLREEFEYKIEAVEPKIVWEFIADFSNHQKLNPTLESFHIEYEHGNYDNWEYGVTYREHLTYFPFIKNTNQAVFKVTPEKKVHHMKDPFRIISQHTTCILYYCVKSDSDMTFTSGVKKDTTKINENVQVECPSILSPYCRMELRNQKKLIYDQLKIVDMQNY